MTVHSETKINQLLQRWPSGTVGLSAWLEETGVSRQLQQHYLKTGWLESVGHGAYKRAGDPLDWLGAVYAMQTEANLAVHVGGRTALGLQGQAHYLELNTHVAYLFAPLKLSLPTWFQNHDWSVTPRLYRTDFLPPHIGLVDVEHKLYAVKASGAARAIMECLYLAPERFELVEAYQIMEGLTTLRPASVQSLLESCRSFKVKRLFLFMAEKAGHAWVKHLERDRIDIGHGKRSLVPGGVYVPQYQMTVPKELATA